jgi:hypothetical protein
MRYVKRIIWLVITISLFLIPITVGAQCTERDVTGLCIEHSAGGAVAVQPQTIEPEWGTNFTTCKSIPAITFTPNDSSMTWAQDGYAWIYRTGGWYWFNANVDLPTGAKVWSMYVNVLDSSATDDVWAWFAEYPIDHSTSPLYASLKTTGSPGYVRLYSSLSGQNIIIDNLNKSYFVRVRLEANDQTNAFGSVQLCYALQVSPAPLTATFNDVPTTHQYFQYIEALAASGITTGYDDDTYRPGSYVTRGQMAVFLSRALGLHWPH